MGEFSGGESNENKLEHWMEPSNTIWELELWELELWELELWELELWELELWELELSRLS